MPRPVGEAAQALIPRCDGGADRWERARRNLRRERRSHRGAAWEEQEAASLPSPGRPPTVHGWRGWVAARGGRGQGSPWLDFAAARLVSCLGSEAPMHPGRRTKQQKVIFPRSFNFRKLTQCDSCPTLELFSSEINCVHFPPPFFCLIFPSPPSCFYLVPKGTHIQSHGCELEGGGPRGLGPLHVQPRCQHQVPLDRHQPGAFRESSAGEPASQHMAQLPKARQHGIKSC